ncbi:hypothetical protein [Sorangium sp. So ce131]|uniref:hypothetical protein n=1 Tax=Sorangium sp. So ce131 TaxID=3133282 RepID=UPI003F609651
MRVTQACIAAAGTLAALAVGWGLHRAPGEVASRAIERAQQDSLESDSLPQRIADVGTKERSRAHKSPRPKSDQASAREPGDAGLRADPRASSSANDLSPAEQDAEAAATLDAAVRSEGVDRDWSSAMESRIGKFFNTDKATGSSARRVDCRSTLCRVEIAHESIGAREHFVERMPYMISPRSMIFAYIEDEDDREIVVYITREGHPLPLG